MGCPRGLKSLTRGVPSFTRGQIWSESRLLALILLKAYGFLPDVAVVVEVGLLGEDQVARRVLRRDGREGAATDLGLLIGCNRQCGGPCQGRPLSLRAVAAFSVTAVRAHD